MQAIIKLKYKVRILQKCNFFIKKHNIFKAASYSMMVYVRTNTLMCYIKNNSSLH